MRKLSLIAALPLLALTACGGASGPETIGSVAPPAGSTGGTGGGGGGVSTPTPTPASSPTPTPTSGGTGGGVSTGGGTGTTTPAPTPAHFLDVSAETSFNAIGAFQTLGVNESGVYGVSGPIVYQGNASTVRSPTGTVTYNPRDGIFTVNFVDTKAGLNEANVRYQDPGFRIESPAWGVPVLDQFNYVQVLGPTFRAATANDLGRSDTLTFFYQRPNAQTKYVSLAGFVRNAFDRTDDALVFKAETQSQFERGAMVFGQETLRSQIPVSGSGSYTGGMLATMVVNTATGGGRPNYFQWITGTSTVTLDFSKQTMAMLLTGTTSAANYGGQELAANATGVPGGSTFRAEGSGAISLTASGGFTGRFSGASFTTTTNGQIVPIYDQVNPTNGVAGANSIDGTFYGPGAVNVGGNFRIVGGVPGQRVDILGAFTGAKQP